MSAFIDLTGKRFGRLTVIRRYPTVRHDGKCNVYWRCLCDCGKYTKNRAGSLTTGNTKSCGCLFKDTITRLAKGWTKHGMSNTRLYYVWCGMRRRCSNPKDANYSNYGARGIKVCAVRNNSASAFMKWALANGYRKGLTLERKNNDKGYSPSNCCWITHAAQSRNTRKNILIEFRGKKRTASEWARATGLQTNAILWRIRHGWSLDCVFSSRNFREQKITKEERDAMPANRELTTKDIYRRRALCQADIAARLYDLEPETRLTSLPIMTPTQLECLRQLMVPVWDGNLLSKESRTDLVEMGLVECWNGLNFITKAGVAVLDTLKMLEKYRESCCPKAV